MPLCWSFALSARTANVYKFRRAYDALHDLTSPGCKYNAVAHFATLNAIALFVIGYCIRRILLAPEGLCLKAGGLTVFLSFLFANCVEYYEHRYIMHDLENPHGDHSAVHHRYFTASSMFLKSFQDVHTILFRVSIVFQGFFFVLPLFGALLNAVAFPLAGYYFLATCASYYLQYEWLHLMYHSTPDSLLGSLPFVGLLRTQHRTHHYQPLMRVTSFNITYPLVDLVMGTYYRGPPVFDSKLDLTIPPKIVLPDEPQAPFNARPVKFTESG